MWKTLPLCRTAIRTVLCGWQFKIRFRFLNHMGLGANENHTNKWDHLKGAPAPRSWVKEWQHGELHSSLQSRIPATGGGVPQAGSGHWYCLRQAKESEAQGTRAVGSHEVLSGPWREWKVERQSKGWRSFFQGTHPCIKNKSTMVRQEKMWCRIKSLFVCLRWEQLRHTIYGKEE